MHFKNSIPLAAIVVHLFQVLTFIVAIPTSIGGIFLIFYYNVRVGLVLLISSIIFISVINFFVIYVRKYDWISEVKLKKREILIQYKGNRLLLIPYTNIKYIYSCNNLTLFKLYDEIDNTYFYKRNIFYINGVNKEIKREIIQTAIQRTGKEPKPILYEKFRHLLIDQNKLRKLNIIVFFSLMGYIVLSGIILYI